MTRWLAAAQRAAGGLTKLTEPPRGQVLSVVSVLSGAEKNAIDLIEERSAIREFDGGQSREAAEAGALGDVARATGLSTGALILIWPHGRRAGPGMDAR